MVWKISEKSITNTIKATGNLTIDPSNNLIVSGVLDMSLNNITNVNDLTLKKNRFT